MSGTDCLPLLERLGALECPSVVYLTWYIAARNCAMRQREDQSLVPEEIYSEAPLPRRNCLKFKYIASRLLFFINYKQATAMTSRRRCPKQMRSQTMRLNSSPTMLNSEASYEADRCLFDAAFLQPRAAHPSVNLSPQQEQVCSARGTVTPRYASMTSESRYRSHSLEAEKGATLC